MEADVEAVATAGDHLRRGQGHPEPRCADAPDVVEQASPPAAEIEDSPSRLDSDLLGHVVVLASLGLLEGQREVAVVLGSAEVGEFPQAETDHAIRQRVAEIDLLAPR